MKKKNNINSNSKTKMFLNPKELISIISQTKKKKEKEKEKKT